MSWKLGLSIGEALVEITALRGTEKKSRRWLLPRRDLKGVLTDFLNTLPDLPGSVMCLATDMGHWILRRRLGTPIGLLVTSGFEDWPALRQPTLENEFRVGVRRTPPFLDSGFVFGVSERIRADGGVETPLDMAELEFLASKLELSGIQQIAIGFLNSQVNPTHEIRAEDYFREKGFQVYRSSDFSKSSNEVARWWRAFLNAYLAANFQGLEKDILEICTPLEVSPHLALAAQVTPWNEKKNYLDSLMGHAHALRKKALQNKSGSLLYMGIESFWLLRPDQEKDIWATELGPVALTHPLVHRLQLQPTSPIIEGLFHAATFGDKELFFDPGPVLCGRGLQLTALDAWLMSGENGWKCLSYDSPEARTRAQNASQALGKKLSFSADELNRELLDLGRALLREEVARVGWPEPVQVVGPLAHIYGGSTNAGDSDFFLSEALCDLMGGSK